MKLGDARLGPLRIEDSDRHVFSSHQLEHVLDEAVLLAAAGGGGDADKLGSWVRGQERERHHVVRVGRFHVEVNRYR